MPCTIDWNLLNFSEWDQRFNKIKRAPLLQSYDYAKAVCPLYGQKPRWGLIKLEGQEAGICQILEAGSPAFLHAVMLDRGPLWFDGFEKSASFEAFISEFNRQFPRRFGRRRRVIPEIEASPQIHELMASLDFRLKTQENYQTFWIDLRQNLEFLRAHLHKSWRQSLAKAEKSALEIQHDEKQESLAEFLAGYEHDRRVKSYAGPSVQFLKALMASFGPSKTYLVNARLDNRTLAAILILCHGTSATYQSGWTSDEGRDLCAHHYLLWDAMRNLKQRGIHHFDLGGVHDQAKGLQSFKQAMGGAHSILPGLYL